MVVLKRFEHLTGSRPKWEQFKICPGNMAVLSDCDDPNFAQYTSEWFHRINRGGLFPVNDITFSFFLAMETITRPNLPKLVTSGRNEPKKILTDLVEADGDVQFYWTLLSQDIEEEKDAIELLLIIAEKWITIRGFALASTWLEEYKKTKKTKVSKKKALRKDLHRKETITTASSSITVSPEDNESHYSELDSDTDSEMEVS